MRDILILGIVLFGSAYALRRPWVGAMLWTWLSLMNPHQFGWTTGNFPVGALVAGCTLVGFVMTSEKRNPFTTAPVWVLAAFVIWTCVTLPFSFYFESSMPLWRRSIKIFFMLFITMSLIDTRRKLTVFIAVIVGSLGFYGLKGGLFTLAHGGIYRVWGPGGFIEGNNELALALVMTIPLMRYLQQQATRRSIRHGLSVMMLMTAVTVLGTHSRGALLAITAMTCFMWLKSGNKFQWGIASVASAIVMLAFMPDHWWDRMATMVSFAQDDSSLDQSSRGRINAWIMTWNLAKANFFGGGFDIYYAPVFAAYSPEPDRIHAAHSIYFQVLGEHGFVGLFLFLVLGLLTWSKSGQLTKIARSMPDARWAADLGPMVQVSLVGYMVGGAFLSLAYFDLPYNLLAVVAVALHLVMKEQRVQRPAGALSAGGGSSSTQMVAMS